MTYLKVSFNGTKRTNVTSHPGMTSPRGRPWLPLQVPATCPSSGHSPHLTLPGPPPSSCLRPATPLSWLALTHQTSSLTSPPDFHQVPSAGSPRTPFTTVLCSVCACALDSQLYKRRLYESQHRAMAGTQSTLKCLLNGSMHQPVHPSTHPPSTLWP